VVAAHVIVTPSFPVTVPPEVQVDGATAIATEKCEESITSTLALETFQPLGDAPVIVTSEPLRSPCAASV
jgi:hypothetical protein